MSAIKANWFVDVESANDDPFGERVVVEAIGRPIELDNGERLATRLDDALSREGQLFTAGITCAIKDDPQASCSACPLRHLDPLDTLTPLCAVGVEQESLITRLRILRIQDEQRENPAA